MRKLICLLFIITALVFPAGAVPVIYCTDLFHPHVDPDDHFDLATLFALPELEVKAILLDQGGQQNKNPGSIPLRQMLRLGRREIPFAVGLSEKLASPSDDGRSQPAEFQAGVELLLKVMRESPQPVTIITAGSVRDVCAAWNRDPSLLKQKVARLYLNIGNANDGGSEYNVDLDPKAYAGLLRSGLPIYLCFCLPMQGEGPGSAFSTWWRFRQADVLESAPKPLQNFFIYALQRPSPDELDPMGILNLDLRPWRRLVWEMERNMWCTASFLHAAGRPIYRSGRSWSLLPPSPPGNPPETLFSFVPARLEVDEAGKTKTLLSAPAPNIHLFKVTLPGQYGEAMRDCLRELFRQMKTNMVGDDVRSLTLNSKLEEDPGLLKPLLNPSLPWLYYDSFYWTAVGLAGTLIFSSRFVIQWLYSERHKRLVIPPIFWHLSFWGSLFSLVYAIHIDKLPVILSFIFLPVLYGRNLLLLKRSTPPTQDLSAG